jgi:hypothetical protein
MSKTKKVYFLNGFRTKNKPLHSKLIGTVRGFYRDKISGKFKQYKEDFYE